MKKNKRLTDEKLLAIEEQIQHESVPYITTICDIYFIFIKVSFALEKFIFIQAKLTSFCEKVDPDLPIRS